MNIATKLKDIIEEKNITQKDIAKIAGVTPGAVSQWLSGESVPRMGRLQKIAIHLGVSVGYFVDKNKTEDNINNNTLRTNEEEAELNEYLEALRTDPKLRMMFSLTKNAKKEDVEKAVAIIKTVLGK